MHAALPAGVLDSDRHGASERAAGAADEARRVERTGQAEEQSRAHVDEKDAPEYLADRARYAGPGVLGLGGGDGDGFDAGVEGAAEDEDRGYAAETISKGARVVPVQEPMPGRPRCRRRRR